ncbi:MAG TPA: cytochrome c biogenesis protein ResB [Opitutaceae bacterium]|nr:cytochrome c biogenesis protein ResB [Opitutaceae bacterium]
MHELLQPLVRFFVSLRLTVVLLVLSIMLVFFATLDQVQLGVWGIQHKWFFNFIVVQPVKGLPVPVFPGGYFIGGMLLINLVAAHIYRFKFTWKKVGIWLAHLGLILLIASQFFTGLEQRESQLQFHLGETKRYSEDFRLNELAVINTTDPKFDDVISIPESLLAGDTPVQNPKLPFRIVPRLYYPNSMVQMRTQAPNAPPSPATMDIGTQLAATPQPLTYKENERNMPVAFVELIGPEGSLGTWLVSPWIDEPQTFDYAGRTWQLVMRFKRYYTPYAMALLQLKNDVYPGTDIPKNFSSQVHIRDDEGNGGRDALIYMNSPLRYGGLTYYQYQMNKVDGLSVLQVVRNPTWRLPYLACLLVGLGLVIQFSLHLAGFFRKRAAAAMTA